MVRLPLSRRDRILPLPGSGDKKNFASKCARNRFSLLDGYASSQVFRLKIGGKARAWHMLGQGYDEHKDRRRLSLKGVENGVLLIL
jgi:hypothetical protein